MPSLRAGTSKGTSKQSKDSNAGLKLDNPNAGLKVDDSNAGLKVDDSNAGLKVDDSNNPLGELSSSTGAETSSFC